LTGNRPGKLKGKKDKDGKEIKSDQPTNTTTPNPQGFDIQKDDNGIETSQTNGNGNNSNVSSMGLNDNNNTNANSINGQNNNNQSSANVSVNVNHLPNELDQLTTKLKDDLKDVEGLKNHLSKLVKANKNFIERIQLHTKYEQQFSELLTKIAEKDKDADGTISDFQNGFALSMARFSQIFIDLLQYATACCNLSNDKFVEKVTDFVHKDIQEETKSLKKKYDKAKLEYEQILVKIDNLNTGKKVDVLKLYMVEKEKVRLKQVYEECAQELQIQCEDIKDRINFDFLESLITFMDAQKTMYGMAYAQFNQLKDYLAVIKRWCVEEASLFSQNQREREANRGILQGVDQAERVKQLLQLFEKDVLVDILKRLAVDQRRNILANVVVLFSQYDIPIPKSLQKITPGTSSELDKICSFIKANFDTIGNKLIELNAKDLLVLLSDAVAQLEKPKLETKVVTSI